MLSALLAVMAGGSVAETVPVVSGLAVASLSAGSCNPVTHTIASNATYRATWNMANTDAANYQTLVYEDGILVSTIANGTLSATFTVHGALAGAGIPFTVSHDYVVKVQAIVGSAIVSTSATVGYTNEYGDCSEEA